MTTYGSDHTSQCHHHPSQVTSDEEHPHPASPDNGGGHSGPDSDGGRHILQYHPPTPYTPLNLTDGHSVHSLTLEADMGDNPAQVRNGWTVAPDGGLCSPNGKVWHLQHFSDRYAISTVNEDGALGTTPYVRYA